MKNEIERLAASDHRRVTLIKFPVHSRLNCQSLKELTFVDSLFWRLGHSLVAVAVVERYKQEPMYGLSTWTYQSCRFRDVAVVER